MEGVLKVWVFHLNEATSALKTLLVGRVVDGRCTRCHRLRTSGQSPNENDESSFEEELTGQTREKPSQSDNAQHETKGNSSNDGGLNVIV